jgi:NADPH:quinone reductase-like Zn-dependent oxidoreductase
MKAIVYRRYGGPEVLEFAEVPEPKISQNDVLVRVKAAALNPADHMLQAGLGDAHMDAWFPVIPGWDVAGVVDQVGAGVSEFAPGDEVIGYIRQEILHRGGYAEWVSTPVETLARKPANASWEAAAGLPLAGLTAFRAVIETLEVGEADTLLVHGAAGGVGVLACQLARAKGARVIGTAAPANHAFLKSIDVSPVAYGNGLVERVRNLEPQGVTAVLDCAGRGVLSTTSELVQPAVRVCSIADGGPGVTTIFARRNPAALVRLVEMFERGQLRAPVAATYPLEQAAAAQAELKQSHGPGKIVLTM